MALPVARKKAGGKISEVSRIQKNLGQFRPFQNVSKEGREWRVMHLAPSPASPAVSPCSSSDPESNLAILPDVVGQDFGSNFGPVSQVKQNFSSNFNVLKFFPLHAR